MSVVDRILRWLTPDTPDRVSDRWLRSQRDDRIEYHGPAFRWPINKRVNEAAKFNRSRLRRTA